jgi:hypothetical protein
VVDLETPHSLLYLATTVNPCTSRSFVYFFFVTCIIGKYIHLLLPSKNWFSAYCGVRPVTSLDTAADVPAKLAVDFFRLMGAFVDAFGSRDS